MSGRTLSDEKQWTTHGIANFFLSHPDCVLHIVGITGDYHVGGGHMICVEMNGNNIMLIGSKGEEDGR